MKFGPHLLCLLWAGCSLSGAEQDLRPDQVRIRTETILDDSDMKVYRLHVTFKGSKGVRTLERGDFGGGQTTVFFRDRDETRETTIPITLSATEISSKLGEQVIRLSKTCVQVDRAGGPSTRGLVDGESVKSQVQLAIKDGIYTIGKPIKICQLLDETVELQVAPVEIFDREEQQVTEVQERELTTPQTNSESVKANDAVDQDHR